MDEVAMVVVAAVVVVDMAVDHPLHTIAAAAIPAPGHGRTHPVSIPVTGQTATKWSQLTLQAWRSINSSYRGVKWINLVKLPV